MIEHPHCAVMAPVILDVVVVNRGREVRQKSRLENDAVGPGMCRFSMQIGVAARLGIELTGRVHTEVAILQSR